MEAEKFPYIQVEITQILILNVLFQELFRQNQIKPDNFDF